MKRRLPLTAKIARRLAILFCVVGIVELVYGAYLVSIGWTLGWAFIVISFVFLPTSALYGVVARRLGRQSGNADREKLS